MADAGVHQRGLDDAPPTPRLTTARGLLPRWSVVDWVCLALTVYLMAPPRSVVPQTGFDPSWGAALSLVRHHEQGAGAGVVFTYGPWGWVNHPTAGSRLDLMIAILFGVVAVTVAWVAVRRALLRGLPRPWAAVGASALLLVMMPAFQISLTLVVGVTTLVLLHVVDRRPFGLAATVGLPAAAALTLQTKFSDGTVLTVIVALGCVVACRPLGRLVVAIGSYLVATVVAWVVMGGSLGELPSWLRLSFEVARTYSDAVAQENEPNTFSYLVIGVTLIAGLTLAVVAHRRLPARSLVVLVLACLAILVLGFKEATTRHEFLRLSAFELGVPVLVLALHRWRGRTAALLVLGFAVLVGNNSHVYLDSGKARLQWATALEVIADPGYQRELLESARATGRDEYAVPPELLEQIGSRPLSVDGYEVALPWYYAKRWDVAPVLQSYTAYSLRLDEADTDWLRSRPDSHRILRPTTTAIDGRNSLWDPPGYLLAELCTTRTVGSSETWLLLAKDADRCSEPRTVSTTELAAGEELRLPAATDGQIVTMSFEEAPPGLLTRLGRLALKTLHPLTVTVDGTTPYRLPRALAAGPLVTRVPEAVGWPAQFGGATSYRTVSFSEAGSVTVRVIDVG